MARGLKKFSPWVIRSRLNGIASRHRIQDAAGFRTSLMKVVFGYLREMSPSEFASEVRRAYRSGDIRKIKKYLPPLPQGNASGLAETSQSAPLPRARNSSALRPADLLVTGRQLSVTRNGKRREFKTVLVGQVPKGFPGRAPELIMISRLASLWVLHGGKVTLGGGTYSRGKDWQPSKFEHLVDDVLVAIGIDDKCSPRALVREHLHARRQLERNSATFICQH